MNSTTQRLVLVGAAGSAAAAALHLILIPFGARALEYFGADRQLVEMAEDGSVIPALVTAGIAALLFVAARYALAQAGLRRPMPWQRIGFTLVAAVFLLRGVAFFPQLVMLATGDFSPVREVVFSAVALVIGLCHVPGLRTPDVALPGTAR